MESLSVNPSVSGNEDSVQESSHFSHAISTENTIDPSEEDQVSDSNENLATQFATGSSPSVTRPKRNPDEIITVVASPSKSRIPDPHPILKKLSEIQKFEPILGKKQMDKQGFRLADLFKPASSVGSEPATYTLNSFPWISSLSIFSRHVKAEIDRLTVNQKKLVANMDQIKQSCTVLEYILSQQILSMHLLKERLSEDWIVMDTKSTFDATTTAMDNQIASLLSLQSRLPPPLQLSLARNASKYSRLVRYISSGRLSSSTEQ